jgi:uncharacterized coiled-coil protein SlyX
MNDMVLSATKTVTSRTPELIAAEINNIKFQTQKMMLYNSIEIGRRLCEAKEMVDHGEWGEWLERSVEYSKSTANNLMRIFEEYGADQITLLLNNNIKSPIYERLTYSQAVALLGIPADQREDFVKDTEVENMSTRELQQVIKERDQAQKEAEDVKFEKEMLFKELQEKAAAAVNKDALIKELEEKLKDSSIGDEDRAKLQKQLEEEKSFSTEKESELAEKDEALRKLKADTVEKLDKNKKQVEDLKKRIKELEENPPEPQASEGASDEELEKAREEARAEAKAIADKELEALKDEKDQAERRIAELEKKAALQNETAQRIKFLFSEFQRVFNELRTGLSEMESVDAETHKKLKGAVGGLIDKMLGSL